MWVTGFTACKLSIVCYVVPFFFIKYPGLLLIGTPSQIAISFALTLICILAWVVFLSGYLVKKLNKVERILAFGAAAILTIGTVVPLGAAGNIVGFILLGAVVFWQLRSRKIREFPPQNQRLSE